MPAKSAWNNAHLGKTEKLPARVKARLVRGERKLSPAATAAWKNAQPTEGAALSAADIATGPSAALAFVGDPSQEAWGMESGGGATPPLATGRGQEPGSMVC